MIIDLASRGGRAPDVSPGTGRGSCIRSPEVVIIGAGPAGLTAAAHLIDRDVCPVVLEADDTVGGISRTVERDGWRFDIGGHRFFTKVPEVERFWHTLLPGEEFMVSAETTHRITNPASARGRVLEIAYGYTTEDDTLRLEDDYGRSLEPDW